jgi:hypothetical protein
MADVRVFLNGRAFDAPEQSSALDALRAFDAAEAAAVDAGDRVIADSRGLAIDPASVVYAGAIYRTMRARPPAA